MNTETGSDNPLIGGPARRASPWTVALLAGILAVPSGCGDDQDPEGAMAFWNRIHDEDYRSWKRAPGYETRRDSEAPHGGAVEIFLNGTMDQAIVSGATTWPIGSLIVKDGYSGGSHVLVAAMEKRATGWYWAEWDSDSNGEAKYSGSPATCTDCHRAGKDFVRLFNP